MARSIIDLATLVRANAIKKKNRDRGAKKKWRRTLHSCRTPETRAPMRSVQGRNSITAAKNPALSFPFGKSHCDFSFASIKLSLRKKLA